MKYKKNLRKTLLTLAILSLVFSASCQTSALSVPAASPVASVSAQPPAPVRAPTKELPSARFAVLSDIHLFDRDLGASDAEVDEYLAQSGKLLSDSEEIFGSALERILAEKPDFILISGDLTKDGERQSHEKLARLLGRVADSGIKVFVLPGNHDIDNPKAVRVLPSGKTERVPSVDPAEFASIYGRFGYEGAVSRDPASLSYVAEPVSGLWLVALDSAKYEENIARGTPESSGAVRAPTRVWLKARLEEARSLGKTVIVSEHHPLMEHFDTMKAVFSKYVVDDNWSLARLLAAYDVRVAFSGHFHANSAVMRRFQSDEDGMSLKGKALYDIETGSLVTWPSPYRIVALGKDGSIQVRSGRVEQLPSYAAEGRNFGVESREWVFGALKKQAAALFKKYFIRGKSLDYFSSAFADAMLAHFGGDAQAPEAPEPDKKTSSMPLPFAEGFFDRLIAGLYKEKAPAQVELMADNDFTVDANGAWRATRQ
jgi:3',5'-cyclic AMP phosphodiesterase CpdA